MKAPKVRDMERERKLNSARCAKYRDNNPKKYNCRVVVKKQIAAGRIVASSACMGCCRNIKTEAHHDDYNKPLQIRWLCKQCHEKWHMNNEPIV